MNGLKHCRTQIGEELATILFGVWRPFSGRDPEHSNGNVSALAPLLCSTGTAALVWFRIRRFESDFPMNAVKLYREAYICSLAQALAHETNLADVMLTLHTSGIRSILLKGWSVARLYPESGLRPCGDIDLWVDPNQRVPALEVLERVAGGRQPIDLDHDQFRRFENRSFADFYAACDTVSLGSAPIRVLRREDQTRILCLHFLKHGGQRPIWLCDIAVLLEGQNTAFNWDLCLGSDSRRARWIGCTIALASNLLGARIPPGAPRCVTSTPPRWFTRTVLTEWSNPLAPNAPSLARVIRDLGSRPWTLKSVARGRWRNPIQATVDCNGPFDTLPRLPYQLWDGVRRAGRFFLTSEP